MNNEVRVRMAPSPTGLLHVGTVRTALFNWLFARHTGGKFVMRIEDTDLERSQREFEADILEGLKWIGLDWDEFYRQSDRLPIYSKYIQKLLDEGKIFWCYHAEEELEKERRDQMEGKILPRHVCSYKNNRVRSDGVGGVLRLAVDENSTRKIQFDDSIHGRIEFEERLLGDFSVAKSLEAPLYNFAVVVDDYEMGITHVIRGDDHIANTPKQVLLQEALGFEKPGYAHLPMILGEDKSKLSKRHGAVSLNEYRKQGYIPEAVFNFLALLGFTPPEGKEILSPNDLLEIFELTKVHKSGAVFDIKKLDWMNKEYMKRQSDAEFVEKISEYMGGTDADKDYLYKVMPLIRERVKKFDEVHEFEFFFEKPEYEKDLLIWKKRSAEEVASALREVSGIIEKGIEDEARLRQELDDLGKRLDDRGLVYWPFRVALSGQKNSPDPVQISLILGRQETLSRIEAALEKF